MSEKKQCPLCGKNVNENDDLCEECRNHVDNQYKTDFLEIEHAEDSGDTDKDLETKVEGEIEKILEEAVPVTSESEETIPSKKKKKGLSKGVVFVLVGCLILIAVGAIGSLKTIQNRESIENEDSFWTACVEENTPVAYAKYLVAFRDGRYIQEANNRIREFREGEARAWEKLRKSSDINDFYAYMAENPNTPHTNQIRFLMDSLSWLATTKDDTEEAYKAYLENVKLGNISGEYIVQAKDRYKYLSEIVVLEGAALDSLKTQVGIIAEGMSRMNADELVKIFAPQISYFGKDTVNTKLGESIVKERKDKKIKKISFSPKKETVKAKKDSKGIYFVELTLNKETIYNIKVKKGRKTEDKKENTTEKWAMQLNEDYRIQKIK